MATIYFNVVGDPGGGGPSVFVYKTAKALAAKKHSILYSNPAKSDIALCIIETGKVLRQIDKTKTKTILRIDGIYCKEYWHGGEGRAWRTDMTALHNKLKQDIPVVDLVVYQSQWSRDRIEDEIVQRPDKWTVIHNGVDINLFKPMPRLKDGFINLFHVGKMRNGYIMESLIGTYNQLKKRGHKPRLILAGNMDNECTTVYNKYKGDTNIKHLGAFPNTKLSQAFAMGDVFLAPRMGSSCDNVIGEAQASGLPVIVPKWGGNCEMVQDGVNGVIVDSGGKWNYGAEYTGKLADAVEKIIPDLGGYKKRAREYAVKNLSIDIMIDKYLKAMGL